MSVTGTYPSPFPWCRGRDPGGAILSGPTRAVVCESLGDADAELILEMVEGLRVCLDALRTIEASDSLTDANIALKALDAVLARGTRLREAFLGNDLLRACEAALARLRDLEDDHMTPGGAVCGQLERAIENVTGKPA